MLKFSLLLIGTLAAGIGCYGTFEHGLKLEGGVSYLVIAAPVVAAAAALLPYFAECAWRLRHRVKAVVLAAVLVPAAATVFYAAAERVHQAKAGAAAERVAARSAVTRAEAALVDAKRGVERAEADAKAARAKPRKYCDTQCVARWDSEATAARQRVQDAAQAVKDAQARAVTEAELQAPVWLLPAALDLVAFVAIWTGLAITKPTVKRRKRRVARRKPVKPVQLKAVA